MYVEQLCCSKRPGNSWRSLINQQVWASYKFSFFVLSYLYNDQCSNAPFLWSLLMTDCSKHRYFNFIFLPLLCFIAISLLFLSLQNKIQFLLDRKSIRNFTTIIKTQKLLWKGNRSLNKARSGSEKHKPVAVGPTFMTRSTHCSPQGKDLGGKGILKVQSGVVWVKTSFSHDLVNNHHTLKKI